MPRLNVVTPEQASGRVKELYDGLKAAVGVVPNIYRGVANSPAAHTFVGRKAGLSEVDTLAIRRGTIADPGLQALVRFVNVAIQPGGRIADEDLNAIRGAGFSDAQITEILMVLAQTVFTTLFNRANRTEVDFPTAPGL